MNVLKTAVSSLIAFILLALPAWAAEPNDAEKMFKEARGLTYKKKYGQADAVYTKTLPELKKIYGTTSEKLANFYFEWAMNSQLQGNHKKTIDLYTRGLAIYKGSNKAHWYDQLAQSYVHTKQFDKAISSYKKALELGGEFKFKKIYYNQKLASVYEKAEDNSNAEAAWKEALKYADVDLGSREEYVKLAQKHPLGPKHVLEDSVDSKVLELFDSLYGLGAFYSERGRLKEAEPLLKRAKSVNDVWIPLEFKKPSFYFDYAEFLKKNNKTEEAEKMKRAGKKIEQKLKERRK